MPFGMAPRRRADIVGPTRHPFEQQALTLRAARGAKIAGEARRIGMVRHDCQNRTQRCRVSDGKLVVRDRSAGHVPGVRPRACGSVKAQPGENRCDGE